MRLSSTLVLSLLAFNNVSSAFKQTTSIERRMRMLQKKEVGGTSSSPPRKLAKGSEKKGGTSHHDLVIRVEIRRVGRKTMILKRVSMADMTVRILKSLTLPTSMPTIQAFLRILRSILTARLLMFHLN